MKNRKLNRKDGLRTSSVGTMWTVVSVVDDRIYCSIHPTEYHAYREALTRLQSAELNATDDNHELPMFLEAAKTSRDYQQIRNYIERKACNLRLLQLAEHDVTHPSGSQFESATSDPVAFRRAKANNQY